MKILIVDDHTLFRVGMVHLLQSFDPPPEVIESKDLQGAIETLLVDSSIDMVLLDLRLCDSSGVCSLLTVRKHVPATSVVVLSGEYDPEVIHACIDAGAMGFISKSATHDELLDAISLIVAGGVYLPKAVTGAHLGVNQIVGRSDDDMALLASLSNRQREVLSFLIQGKPNKIISENLNISQNTVKAHLSGIFKTLGARNRTEAVYFAARAGVPLE